METKHIKVILGGDKLIKISSRKLPDGSWSVVGWGPTLSVRSTDIDNDQLLYEFAYATLFINDEDPNSIDAGEIVAAIREAIQ